MRPRVICHMAAAIDGRIVVDGWPESVATTVRHEYEAIHESYRAEAWICGRVTMERFAQATRSDAEVALEHGADRPREDFRAPGRSSAFAFVVDPGGRLSWARNEIDGDHIVAILSARVSDAYLARLRESGVSYLLAGVEAVDLPVALSKVGALFGVRTLLLEGGGTLNGSMLREGLIDELSLVVAPVADGRMGTPTVADAARGDFSPCTLTLTDVQRREGGVVWLRYRVGVAGNDS